jgi:uncharacterized membrane protein YedE/YeeE
LIVHIDASAFTPGTALAGGILIGLAATAFILLLGRIAGVSGVVGGLLGARRGDIGWRLAFVAGLLAAPALVRLFAPLPPIEVSAPHAVIVAAGLLVGFGSRLGSGCTSGHGVCGIARLSPRSIAATATFMAAGFAVVYVTRHLLP